MPVTEKTAVVLPNGATVYLGGYFTHGKGADTLNLNGDVFQQLISLGHLSNPQHPGGSYFGRYIPCFEDNKIILKPVEVYEN